MAIVVITADEEVTYIPSPRFEKAIYRGNIDENGVLSVEDPTIDEDSYSQNLTFSLTIGDDSDLFVIEPVTLYSVRVSLKAPLTEENLIGKTVFVATITADHPEAFSGTTVLLIDLPGEPAFTTPKPAFQKSLIRGSISSQLELDVETIVLAETSYTPEIIFSIEGGNYIGTIKP